MSLIKTSVNRPVTVWMFMVAIILFGMVGFSRLAVKLLPDLSYPTITIRSQYPGAAPVEVEQLVAKPIEESVGVVKGLRKISSVSRAGMSDVILEFEWGTNMDMAILDTREKLDTVQLPLDIKKPLILRFNPNLDPIVRFALTPDEGSSLNLKTLRTLADEELKRQFEAVGGVATVRLSGGLEREIQIVLNQQQLSQLNLSAEAIQNRIARENMNVSAGKVIQGDKELLVRTLNQFDDLEQLRQVVVYQDNTKLVRLGDIAQVLDEHKERSDMVRLNGKEAVELSIYKEGDANTVAVAQRLRDKMSQINQGKLPVKVGMIYDQSEFIESAVGQVTSAALMGSVLAMLIIYLFLRDVRATLIISLSIPFSVIATFNMMYFANISLNIMSLGGIALAVGLLVDNAIVVLENIDRYKQQGLSRLAAAVKGTSEVSGAIVASTLTSLAVFVPLIFVEGVAGALFSDQALTVAFALIASLLVALTAIPMLASRSGFQSLPEPPEKPEKAKPTTRLGRIKQTSATVFSFPFWLVFNWIPAQILTLVLLLSRFFAWLTGLIMRPIAAAFQWLYGLLESLYKPMIGAALRFHWATLAIALIFTLSIGSLLPKLGVELIPRMNQGEFYVEIQLPPGTDVSQTDNVLRQLASSIQGEASVKTIYSQAGSGGLLTSDSNRAGEHWGRLHVVLNDAEQYAAVAQKVRMAATRVPELESKVKQPELFTFKTPLEIELNGYNLEQLKAASLKLVDALAARPRYADVQSSLRDGQPELTVRFDHARLAALGMDAPTVAAAIANRVGGQVASQYTVRDRKIDILVRSQLSERDSVEDVEQLLINPDAAYPVPLSAVADLELAKGPSAINRVAQQRVAIVSANLNFGDLSQAVEEAQWVLEQVDLPNSIQAQVAGQNEEMESSFRSLQIALLLAVFLVYVVMASQFESLLHPLLILVAIPMAAAGSILGLFITGTHLSVVVFIGLIMLAGIVVNNAIVLVDRINQLRASGKQRLEAIREAAESRLRPIMMTTLTTTLGLMPMALGLGDGGEVRAPMAITVIFGLVFATLLTLVVIPALYASFDRKRFAKAG
ncbi:efflux RND transporter permease subunit [Paraferrimonas sedimenticola]|uniref:Acriflavin resistance protein n=1 Tax=Paraferrimonas sedimenticola TaxID=375674 RepID=A0AA37RU58_9GAMM|nr:efflux RND transporter permease subunit [Paraferrimonas sedimenticola]GLP94874.1 acriflavin resistance protein [Paraferrimonas sedimenticola]